MKNQLFQLLALFIFSTNTYGEGDCASFSDDMLCGKHMLYVQRLTNNNIPNPIALQFEVTLKEFDNPSNATILNQIITNINDPGYFKHIGVLQMAGVSTLGFWDVYEVQHGYVGGFAKKFYTIEVTVANSNSWYSPHLYYLAGISPTCGKCPTCFHKAQFTGLLHKVYVEYFGRAKLNIIPPGSVPGTYSQADINDLKNILVPFVISSNNFDKLNLCEQSHELCCDEGGRSYDVCNCYPALLRATKLLKQYVNEEPHTTQEILTQLYSISKGYDCSCVSDYCYFVQKNNSYIEIHAIPASNPEYPAVIIYLQLINGVYEYAVGVNYPLVKTLYSSTASWSFASLPSAISYNNGNGFSVTNGFTLLNEEAIKEECEIDCENCLTSFAPFEQKEYIVSAWVRENSFIGKSMVTGAALQIEFLDIHGTVIQATSQFIPAGSLIDGWGRIFEIFMVPAGATKLKLNLISLGSDDVYFDDIRIFPVDGSMKSYVYDPISRKLVAELDEQNYASIYEYDEEGQLIRVKKETERGIMTIKEVRSNIHKK